LSGGETFLTSLSLALGLSDQVQRAAGAVHLDSLFIDEGFVTLDPDTLALVSETIQGLRVGGRTVGIIPHIPAAARWVRAADCRHEASGLLDRRGSRKCSAEVTRAATCT
jgi:exonuclease SbcC